MFYFPIHIYTFSRSNCLAFFDVFPSFPFRICHNVLFSVSVFTHKFSLFFLDVFSVSSTMFYFQPPHIFKCLALSFFHHFRFNFVTIVSFSISINIVSKDKCLVFHDNFHHFRFEFVTMSYFQSPYTRFQLTLVITFLLFS